MRGKNAPAWSKEEERGEKKCLPRPIYPPPIIKSHRHDPIRLREADGVKILKIFGVRPHIALCGGLYGDWGGQYGVDPVDDPMPPSLTTDEFFNICFPFLSYNFQSEIMYRGERKQQMNIV